MMRAVSDLAKQTNLLALNATIEAARQGSRGHGASVIAGEVKDLAREIGRAAETLSQRWERVEHGVRESKGLLAQAVEQVEHMCEWQESLHTMLGRGESSSQGWQTECEQVVQASERLHGYLKEILERYEHVLDS